MSRLILIVKKDLKSYFRTPYAYVLAALFSAVTGWMFFSILMASKETYSDLILSTVMRPMFGNLNLTLLLMCPIVTMKMLAEEKKNKTLDLLQRSPLKELELLSGKIIASFLVVVFISAFSFVYPVLMAFSGYTDWPVIILSYIGLYLNVLCFVSVGIFTSSLTENQIVAAVTSFCILFAILLLVLTGSSINNQMLGQIMQYMSTAFHYEGFSRGALKSYNIIYYISFICFFGFMTIKSLKSRTW